MEKVSELCCENYPSLKGVWRVFIDDELISDIAEPIYPSLPGFDLFYRPVDWQSYGYVVIRSLGEHVLWLNPAFMGRKVSNPDVVPFDVKVFHRDQYATAIGPLKERYRGIYLSPEEFQEIIRTGFPSRDDAIYTTPSQLADPRGDRLLKSVYKHFFDVHPPPWSDGVEVTAPPERWREIRIGLDREGFPEAVWRVGRTPTGIAVWFVEYPSFPLWLCGEHVDLAFAPFVDAIMRQAD